MLIFLTMLLCFVVRVASLDFIPSNVTADEGDTLRTYLYLKQQPISIFSLNWNGSSAVNTYLIGSLWTAGGESFESIKYASISMSMIALLGFYLIVLKISKNPLLTSLATTALSTNVAFLNFSRSGWENVFTSIPLLLLVYILNHKPFPLKFRDTALFVIAMVVSMYFYHPGKVLFAISYIWYFVRLIRSQISLRRKLRNIVVISAILCALGMPLLYSTLSPNTNGIGRISNVSIFNTSNPPQEFAHNLVVNTKAIFLWENNNLRYAAGGTVLNPLILVLYLVSFVFALFFNRKILIFLLSNFLIIQTLSTRTPDVARAVHLIPLIYYLIIMTIVGLKQRVKKLKQPIKGVYSVFYIIVLASLALSTLYDMRQYILFATNPETIEARRPAVRIVDYADWLSMTKQSPLSISLSQWENLVKTRSYSH